MRPSRIIAFVDAGAVGVATAVFARPSPLSLTYAVVTVVVMWAGGAYRPRIFYRVSTQIPALLGEITVATLIVSAWPASHGLTLVEHLPVTIMVVVTARFAAYWVWRAIRSRSGSSDNALIVGAGQRGCMAAKALLRSPGCGINPIGFVGRGPSRPDSPLPVVADVAQLEQVIVRLGIKHVIVADAGDADRTVSSRLWHCRARDVEVWAVPSVFELAANPCGRATDDLWAIPFQHLRRPGQHTGARLVKRAFDVAVAATLMVLMAPVLVAVALAVRLTSPGPAFFRQTRIGQNGRPFQLLKFRTMIVNDDSDTKWSVHDDRRMTPLGRFLRRSCIDELPQIFNVLRGDMSLVGPRPERPYFDRHFGATVAQYSDRLRSPVGITGWAQIHGLRGDTSIAERTRFDNFYIEHWSMWLDVIIMVRTLSAILQWIFRGDALPSGAAEVWAEPASRTSVSVPANAGGNQS